MQHPQVINIEVNKDHDCIYVLFNDAPVSYSKELSGMDIILDFAADDSVVGLDIQHVSALLYERPAPTHHRVLRSWGEGELSDERT